MDLDTFFQELARLKQESGLQSNLASYQCQDCTDCGKCMFCQGCQHCYSCTHCTKCAHCTKCSHCSGCLHCHECAYCRESRFCLGSSYLVHCAGCVDSTYLYGCVGLIKKEFHILNVRYPRREYFEITQELDEAWRIRSLSDPAIDSQPPTTSASVTRPATEDQEGDPGSEGPTS